MVRSPLEKWKEPFSVMIVQNSLDCEDPIKNLYSASDLVKEGLDQGDVDLVVLPELFATGFDRKIIEDPREISHRTIDVMMEISSSYGTNIAFSTPHQEDDRSYNRTYWMDRKGSVRGHYDKTHLFSRTGEDSLFNPGGSLRIFDMEGVPIGVITCYEIRYPEIALSLAGSGAGILINPAQWPDFRIDQWRTLLRARAIENQLFVVGVNIAGSLGGYTMGGSSCIVEPYGDISGSLGSGPGVLRSSLDPAKIERFRKNIRMEHDRRNVTRVQRI